MFGRCSPNSYLSAILDQQGLQVATPIDLRTKKAESFSPQLIQGFWQKIKEKNPKIVGMSPTFVMKDFRKDLVEEKCAISPENSTIANGPPAWRENQVDFPQPRQCIASTGINTSLA